MTSILPTTSPAGLSRSPGRKGFTMAETAIALGLLAGVAAMVAQMATWAILQRGAIDARLEAAEIVANELELAQTVPWEGLTPEWAATRKLPAHVLDRWPDAQLTVRVAPEPNQPRVKRLTAQVKWTSGEKALWRPTTLTALFAARAPGGGP